MANDVVYVYPKYPRDPSGIVRKYFIPYGNLKEDKKILYLEARVIGITEEGFDNPEWFRVEIGYPPNENNRMFFSELGDILNYKNLARISFPSIDIAISKLKDWCKQEDFRVFEMAPAKLN